MLSAVPLLWRVLGVVAIVAALGGGLRLAYDHMRKEAYDAGYSDMKAVCEREKAEQREANRVAIEEAGKKLAEAAYQLSIKEGELADAQARNDEAADTDSPGGLCIGPGGVRHLSAIH